MDGLYSDDLVFEEPPNPFAHLGQRSIEDMVETRVEDRIKTKKRMATLQDTAGAPSTVRSRALWMNRLQIYLTQARGFDAAHVPTGDDIARFAETIVGKLKPSYKNKPVAIPLSSSSTTSSSLAKRLDALTLFFTLLSKRASSLPANGANVNVSASSCYVRSPIPGSARDKVVTVEPLESVENNVLCPIKSILIQALRTGHVAETSIDAVLLAALSRPSRTVKWVKGSDPVVPSIKRPFLDFSTPAATQQVVDTIKAAGLLAGILEPLVSHDIRAGAARDVSKLASGLIKGSANEDVAKAMGHHRSSLFRGTTDDYVGGIESAVNTLIATDAKIDRFAPAIAPEGYLDRSLSTAEITKYCEENGLDPSVKKNRHRAGRALRKDDQDQWITEQKKDLNCSKSKKTLKTNPLAEISVNTPPLKRKWSRNSKNESLDNKPPPAKAPRLSSTQKSAMSADNNLVVKPPVSVIDPRLLTFDNELSATSAELGVQEEQLESVNVDQAKLFQLQSLLVGDPNNHNISGDADEALEPQLEEQACEEMIDQALNEVVSDAGGHGPAVSDPLSVLRLSGNDFVDYFAKINITFGREANVITHIKDYHDWVPKKCTEVDCPKPDKTWVDGSNYNRHQREDHDKDWTPTTCKVPGCTSTATFSKRHLYQKHLRNSVHEFRGAEQERHLPRMQFLKEDWTPITCKVPGCKSTTTFSKRLLYTKHLRLVHEFRGAQQERYLPRLQSRKRKQYPPRVCPDSEEDDDDDEDEG
ncbi:hypothetical protein LTR28_004529 [Elasticomyces elasticus]|nr:hypothetical protein LTR28_004529 [Elasticomyces elasticus]